MCSKILNHPSDKLGYCGITRPHLRVLFMLKIGKGKKALLFKNPTSVKCAMRDERLRDWLCGILVVKRCVSHLSVIKK